MGFTLDVLILGFPQLPARALRFLHEIPLLARAINEAWGISRKANWADSAGFDKCLPHLGTCYVSGLWFANDAPRGSDVSSRSMHEIDAERLSSGM
ncbi:hypothetical protein NPIL_112591 [Nephila pilipes]|uniref:Uncharacterized protein n=1 Tax=Nephila pilipes TaxID=299642 RepID=A0A8X6T8N7_NEPPI|nr:hypothetical protein NPIL_112591 [Nephila pilipes]